MSIIKILKYFFPYIRLLILMAILIFCQAYVTLALPDYMAKIINQGIIGQDSQIIFHNGGLMMLLTIGGGLATIGVNYLVSRIGAGFARDLRNEVFTKVENFSLVEINKFSIASLITRTTNDIQQIQMVCMMLFRIVLMAPLISVLAIIKAYQLAPSMTWIMGVAVAALMFIVLLLFKLVVPKFNQLQKLVDKLNLVTREILTGLKVIKSFNKEKYEEEKFNKVNQDLTKLYLFC